jgi:PhoPQ-activated pathogenicity-related protein
VKCKCLLDEKFATHTLMVMEQRSSLASARRFSGFLVLLMLACVWSHVEPCQASSDALADYVGQPDNSFAWKQTAHREVGGVTAVRLDCASQTWRGHLWQHQMLIVRPPELRNKDVALLFITGDGNVDDNFDLLKMLALRAGALAAVINRVPNQPLYDGRKEDALIAYTFDQYLSSGDRSWPLLFPMAKSAVRGMDAVQALARQEFGQKVSRFVVTGASKRGWTTWLSAAVDPRVKAIAPIVIDMLNMKVQTQWAAKMYGRQSEQIEDYTSYHLPERMDEPGMVELRRWVDPYSYRARYTLPKLLLLGTNDPYWVVDSLRHYWSDLREPKLVFQTPNAGHDLGGGEQAKQTLAAFFQLVADRQSLPKMTWKFSQNSQYGALIDVHLNQPAKAFRLWTASSSDRDFRDDTWSSMELHSDLPTQVQAQIETPKTGYKAYLIEADLVSPDGSGYKLSTEARVTPDGPPAQPAAPSEILKTKGNAGSN